MGDVGNYWRDHEAYERRVEQLRNDRESARAMGMSISEYHRWCREIAREAEIKAHERKIATHTILCECGKTFIGANDHNNHKRALGKKGHKAHPLSGGDHA